VAAPEARQRILEAARRLLRERPFGSLNVRDLMNEAGLARTIFYRHFDALADLAPELLPDSGDPLADQVARLDDVDAAVRAIVDGQIALYAEHGPLLRAVDDAANHDPDFAAQLDTALVGPRRLLARMLAEAATPPPDPAESARLLMAAHREYLLDTFGYGEAPRGAKEKARAALMALWERVLG
jgi:AcrR family transcriptional regulator